MRTIGRSVLVLAVFCTGASTAATATDGHFLHGVGAVNAAMGGAGMAVSRSLLGTFYLNPAGLMGFNGTRAEFGFELFKPSRTVSSDVPGFGSGATTSKSDFVPVPAMALSVRLKNDKMVLGLGAVGIGGFGVDYSASDPTQPGANPILLPQPNGFGQVYSNYSMLKIAPAFAIAATSKLWIGAAVDVDWASLAVQPMPIAPPACTTPAGPCYYPSAAAADGAFGFGFQVGATYNFNDMVSAAVAYTSPQWFSDFTFNSTNANPALPNYGSPIEIPFRLDAPQVFAAGVGLKPLPSLTIAVDGRYMTYANTAGFSGSGFNADGSVAGFGWEDIFVLALGAEYWLGNNVALRAGYNHTDNPIPDSQSFYNVPAPAVVQDHLTLGLGFKPTRQLQIDLGYYHAFENTITGPIPNPSLPPNSTVTNSLSEDSFLIQFTVLGR
jgi:long-chain fatty acid transport protein